MHAHHSLPDAWDSYRAMHNRLEAAIARDLELSTGLSMPDYDVLAAVGSSTDQCIRVSALATSMGWAKSRLSRQLGRMERRGLIAREPCELDGRGDDVVVTELGRRSLREAKEHYRCAVTEHVTRVLSEAQLNQLADIAHTVRARHEKP